MIVTKGPSSNASTTPVENGLKDARLMAATETLLALFGATSLHPLKMQLSAGLERLHDVTIERAVLRRIDAQEPQTFLEIGAGRSYPQQSLSQGVPYLARSLGQIASGTNKSVICSDLIGVHEKVVFFLHRGGILSTHGQTLIDATLPVSELVVEKGRVAIAPLVADGMQHPELVEPTQTAEVFCRQKVERVFVRPALDAELERSLFGLSCVPQVDFCTLAQCADNSIDVLFARHVNPYIVEAGDLPLIMSAVARVLSEGGEAILHVDGKAPYLGEKRDGLTTWNR
jgi:hypothetical protein